RTRTAISSRRRNWAFIRPPLLDTASGSVSVVGHLPTLRALLDKSGHRVCARMERLAVIQRGRRAGAQRVNPRETQQPGAEQCPRCLCRNAADDCPSRAARQETTRAPTNNARVREEKAPCFAREGRASARGGGASARGGGASARGGGASARGGGASARGG